MWLWIYLWIGFLWISTGVLLPEPFRWIYIKDGEPDLLSKFVAIGLSIFDMASCCDEDVEGFGTRPEVF